MEEVLRLGGLPACLLRAQIPVEITLAGSFDLRGDGFRGSPWHNYCGGLS